MSLVYALLTVKTPEALAMKKQSLTQKNELFH